MNKNVYPVYKEKIKKTSICLLCKEPLVMSKGNQKYHAWCSDKLYSQRMNRK